MLKYYLIGLTAVLATADEPSGRSARQLFNSPKSQPSIQYYFIDKVIQNAPAADSADGYEQTPANLQSLYGDYDSSGEQVSTRQLGIFGGIFNNRFTNGNANLNNYRPVSSGVFPFVRNPNFNGLLSSYEPCSAGNGQSGVCVMPAACAIYGGSSSGNNNCGFGSVCCINTVSKCAATVTLNNTYFQSPATQLSTPTSCTLTVKLDKRLPEQRQAVCQIRLDFVSFTLAQPSAVAATSTQCLVDNFQVGGALNTVPTICGDNDGQHMYLHVPRSDNTPSDVRLTFNLGTASLTRTWNIRIAMLPCASTNLGMLLRLIAPADCLQYYTSSSGTVSTFNWKDTTATVRQLANQDYKICWRNEMVNNQRANSMCITQCAVTSTGAKAFSLNDKDGTSQTATSCLSTTTDYIIFPGAVNAAASKFNDRLCGGTLNPDAGKTDVVTVCSSSKPFELYYKTDSVDTADEVTGTNTGFCLTYLQRAV